MLTASFGPFAQAVPQVRERITIHQRIIVRLPRMGAHPASSRASPHRPVHWTERDADRCFAVDRFVGANIARRDSIDLLLDDGGRLRARLEERCPALGFYRGLYMKAGTDGMICARRDSIRSRSGNSCAIENFSRLVPER
ncbi:hypothetical protein [Stakelama saccharophila]|uniref:Uncharacterized protein n=1 Tax=Stakelama saccharophila TaxID=3075605 RepID=A0ABZ0B6Z4_9SPHN|nr:hypothetical protein [Stakelama sp. W311]WNO53197.1 hypothetical protein RPR59_12190 [Stakelama sp. W311]